MIAQPATCYPKQSRANPIASAHQAAKAHLQQGSGKDDGVSVDENGA
jgi:hypothetical protein